MHIDRIFICFWRTKRTPYYTYLNDNCIVHLHSIIIADGSFRVKSPKKMKFETVPPHILMKIYTFGKEDLPNNSVFGKVLSEIWALKVLLKQPKLARPPHKKHATTPKV